jgi:hypothetical protein
MLLYILRYLCKSLNGIGLKVMLVRLNVLNAFSPMLVTLLGIVMFVSPVHAENASSAILATPSGIL